MFFDRLFSEFRHRSAIVAILTFDPARLRGGQCSHFVDTQQYVL